MTQAVFLVDIGAFRSKRHVDQNEKGKLLDVRRTVLRILCYLDKCYSKHAKHLRWGYKFFNSEASLVQIMEKYSLRIFNLESFEEFESDVEKKYSRFMETINIFENSRFCEESAYFVSRTTARNILKEAISQLFCDYTWNVPDVSSPDKTVKPVIFKQSNFLFVISCFSTYSDSHTIESVISTQLLNAFTQHAYLCWIDVKWEQVEDDKILMPYNDTFVSVPLNVLADEHIQRFIPVSTALSNLFAFCDADVYPSVISLAKNNEDICLLNTHPLLKKSFNFLEPTGTSEKSTNEETGLLTKFSRFEIIGTIESTKHLFSSLREEFYFCTSNSDIYSLLLQSLLDNSYSLVVLCVGPKIQSKHYGIIYPIHNKLGNFAVLEANSEIFQWCQSLEEKPMMVASDLSNNIPTPQLSEKNMTVGSFDASVLEKWGVPLLTQQEENQLNVIATSGSISKALNKYMVRLQKVYHPKYPNLACSDSSRASSIKGQKSTSEQVFQEPKKSTKLRRCKSATLNVSLRSSRLVEESLQPRVKKRISAHDSLPSQKIPDIPKHILKISQGCNDEDTLFQTLREMYSGTVSGGSCLLTCAQTIISVICHHANTAKVSAQELAEQHFLLSAKKTNEKYETDSLGKEKKLREYQLQTLLYLELESHGISGTLDSTENVILLLRTMSFLSGAQELSRFLRETIKENYGETLRAFLEDVSDELSFPLFPPDSPEETENRNLFSVASSNSVMSTYSSNSAKENVRQKRNIVTKHPSFSFDAQKHQIHVPKHYLPRRKSKQERASTKKASRQKPSKSKQNQVGKVCRNLFEKDNFATSSSPRRKDKVLFVPETPREKQGRRQRNSSISAAKNMPLIVEESPCKVVLRRIDEESPMKRAKSNDGSCTSPKTPSAFRTRNFSQCSATPKSVVAEGKDNSEIAQVLGTPSKRTENTSETCRTPKLLRHQSTPINATPDLKSRRKNSCPLNTRSNRRLFTSPKERTPVCNKASANENKSPVRGHLPRVAQKNVLWPVKFLFSPKKDDVAADSIDSIRETEFTKDSGRCSESLRTPSLPKRAFKNNDKGYVKPSALSILHLTTSPVLNIPVHKHSKNSKAA